MCAEVQRVPWNDTQRTDEQFCTTKRRVHGAWSEKGLIGKLGSHPEKIRVLSQGVESFLEAMESFLKHFNLQMMPSTCDVEGNLVEV